MTPLDKKTSEVQVQGSGRTIFALVNIVFNLIDDELQVSDAHKCAGKKVDNGARVVRAATSAVNKGSVAQKQGKLGGGCPNAGINWNIFVPKPCPN